MIRIMFLVYSTQKLCWDEKMYRSLSFSDRGLSDVNIFISFSIGSAIAGASCRNDSTRGCSFGGVFLDFSSIVPRGFLEFLRIVYPSSSSSSSCCFSRMRVGGVAL